MLNNHDMKQIEHFMRNAEARYEAFERELHGAAQVALLYEYCSLFHVSYHEAMSLTYRQMWDHIKTYRIMQEIAAEPKGWRRLRRKIARLLRFDRHQSSAL